MMSESSNFDDFEGSTTYTGYGIRGENQAVINTPVGPTKTFSKLKWVEWFFLGSGILNILIAVALTTYRLSEIINNQETGSADFTFAVLLLINEGISLFYVFHGLLREKKYEIGVYCLTIIIVVVYCSIDYGVNDDDRTVLKLVRLILAVVLGFINIVLAWFVANNFGFLKFKTAGALESKQEIYTIGSLLSSALMLDCQLMLSVMVMELLDGTSVKLPQIISSIVTVSVNIMWFIFGWYLILRKEKNQQQFKRFLWSSFPRSLYFCGILIYLIYLLAIKESKSQTEPEESETAVIFSRIAAVVLDVGNMIFIIILGMKLKREVGQGLSTDVLGVQSSEGKSLLTGRRP